MKHTPGPWKVTGDTGMNDSGIIMAGKDVIAVEVYGEANAHLIAAAPEMYEALKILITTYWKNKGSKSLDIGGKMVLSEFIACITPKGIPDYWRKADEAIAKAEGEDK